MAFADELAELKTHLKESGVAVGEVLASAGVDRSTWTRWGQGQTPRHDRWEAVKAAAASLVEDRSRPQDAAA